jgi:nucleotide-binding universal stress UspA family protein
MALDAAMEEEARQGETVLSEAEKYADEMDYEVSGELLQARDAGHAIVDEAAERDASAIVLGVSYSSTMGEFELEPDAQYVVKNAPCQVILCRSSMSGAAA